MSRSAAVAGSPAFPIVRSLFPGNVPLPRPLDSPTTRLYTQARYALWHGVRALGFVTGTEVAFPSFHCGTELEPVLRAGLTVRFYDVGENLLVDRDALDRCVTPSTRALFVTHYFGLPQDVAMLAGYCRERGLALIEDCAHVCPGGPDVTGPGTAGDIAVFSLRKVLPLMDGAALVINNRELSAPEQPRDSAPRSVLLSEYRSRTLYRLAATVRSTGLGRWVLDSVLRRLRGRPDGGDPLPGLADVYGFHADQADWRMSRISERLLRQCDWEQIRSRRRENFHYLAERLKPGSHIKPLIPSMPPNFTPWLLPLCVSEPEALLRHLCGSRVDVGWFWQRFHGDAIIPDDCPGGGRLKRRCLALPIHQGIGRAELDAIAAAVNDWEAGSQK